MTPWTDADKREAWRLRQSGKDNATIAAALGREVRQVRSYLWNASAGHVAVPQDGDVDYAPLLALCLAGERPTAVVSRLGGCARKLGGLLTAERQRMALPGNKPKRGRPVDHTSRPLWEACAAAGMTRSEAAASLGKTWEGARWAEKAYGLTFARRQGQKKAHHRKDPTRSDDERLLDMLHLRDRGISLKAIAARLGVSQGRVQRELVSFGRPPQPSRDTDPEPLPEREPAPAIPGEFTDA